MAQYEYRVVQGGGGAAIAHLNDRINAMAEEGWEVVAIAGEEVVNVLMRRPKEAASEQSQSQPQSEAATQ